jgi:hypothetical protein
LAFALADWKSFCSFDQKQGNKKTLASILARVLGVNAQLGLSDSRH